MIVLAAGVIVTSLIIANIGLPAITRWAGPLPDHASSEEKTDTVRFAAAQAALKAVRANVQTQNADSAVAGLHASAAMRVMADYEQRIEVHAQSRTNASTGRSIDALERTLRLVAVARRARGVLSRREDGHALRRDGA